MDSSNNNKSNQYYKNINDESKSIPWDPGDKKYKKGSKQTIKVGNYIYFSPHIGKGSFSKVYLGHNKTKKQVAIKKIDTTDLKKMSATRLKREIELLKKLKHPNVVEFIDSFTDIGSNVYVVTEYCNYGSLEQYIGNKKYAGIILNEEEIKSIIIQLKDGLKFLLSNNVLHRDLKPQNILLHKEGDVLLLKIADFGFAKYFENMEEDSMMETLCGTPLYLAPEIVKDKKYTIFSDLWSVGVIIYQLFYHTTPFKQPKTILELLRNLEKFNLSFPGIISSDARDLMKGLLTLNPVERITWGNFFEHKWFTVEINGFNDSIINSSIISTIISSKSIIAKTNEPKLNSINLEYMKENTSSQDILLKLFKKENLRDSLQDDGGSNILTDYLKNGLQLNDSKIDKKEINYSHENNDIDLRECFLNQSSKLYQNLKFLDNYIPQSSSYPTETHIMLQSEKVPRYRVYGSSISPLHKPLIDSGSVSPFNLSDNIPITKQITQPITIIKTRAKSMFTNITNISTFSNIANSSIKTINPIFQMIESTINSSINYISKFNENVINNNKNNNNIY